jgi:exonuclease SbcC
LVDGEACPLCGAQEHPFASNTPIFDLQEAALKSKKELLNTKRDLKASTQANLNNEVKNIKDLNRDIIAINALIQPKYTAIETLCKNLQIEVVQNIEGLEAIESRLVNDSKTTDKLKKAFELRHSLKNLKETTALWIKSADLKTTKQTERKKLYPGEDIDAKVQTLTNNWTATNQNIKNTSELIATLKKKAQQFAEAGEGFQKQLQALLKNEGIENVGQLKTFILSEAKAEDIRQRKKTLDLKQERLKTEKEGAQKEIGSFKKLITSKEPVDALQLKFAKIEEEYGSLGERIGSIKTKLEADKKAKEKQEDLLNTLKSLKKEETLWKTMNHFIGDAHGKRFSNFVQDLTLEQLIGYTNMRLKDLSDRYILDIPTADEASKNDSLKVFDSHQGDARRSINTLSGGETFMVSLAMAFALSDLAAKNVKIESIFIDEGFGTLDPETLNQAITILEKMQNEGDKSIGIISHVEALKERISTQIRLEKMGSGYSTIEIV